LQKKAAPGPDPAAADQTDPTAGATDEAQVHEWAGDAYESDDVSDPAAAFASFSGVDGEQAWLDRHDDGTLVGWVRDADGTVYRYTDADAWAIDVQDAGMRRTDEEQDAPADGDAAEGESVEGEPVDAAPADAAPVDDPAAAAAPADLDPAAADETIADGEALDDLAAEEDADLAADPSDPLEDDEEEDPPFQTKSFAHASGVGRILVSPR